MSNRFISHSKTVEKCMPGLRTQQQHKHNALFSLFDRLNVRETSERNFMGGYGYGYAIYGFYYKYFFKPLYPCESSQKSENLKKWLTK